MELGLTHRGSDHLGVKTTPAICFSVSFKSLVVAAITP